MAKLGGLAVVLALLAVTSAALRIVDADDLAMSEAEAMEDMELQADKVAMASSSVAAVAPQIIAERPPARRFSPPIPVGYAGQATKPTVPRFVERSQPKRSVSAVRFLEQAPDVASAPAAPARTLDPVSVEMRVLQTNYDEMPKGSTLRRLFKEAFFKDIVRVTNLNRNRFKLSGLDRGVLVRFNVVPDAAGLAAITPEEVAQLLQGLVANKTSLLYKGSLTRLVDPTYFKYTKDVKQSQPGLPLDTSTSTTSVTRFINGSVEVCRQERRVEHRVVKGSLVKVPGAAVPQKCVLYDVNDPLGAVPNSDYAPCPKSCPNPRTCRCVPKPSRGQGEPGAPGPAGSRGVKGDTGDRGPQGPRGDNATFPHQGERVLSVQDVLSSVTPNAAIQAKRLALIKARLEPKWATSKHACPDGWTRDHYSPTEQRVYCVPPTQELRADQGPFNGACAFPARFPKHFDRCGWSIHCQAPWKKYACWAKGDGAQPWVPADLDGKSNGPLQSTLSNGLSTLVYGAPNKALKALGKAAASEMARQQKILSRDATGPATKDVKKAQALRDSIIHQ